MLLAARIEGVLPYRQVLGNCSSSSKSASDRDPILDGEDMASLLPQPCLWEQKVRQLPDTSEYVVWMLVRRIFAGLVIYPQCSTGHHTRAFTRQYVSG